MNDLLKLSDANVKQWLSFLDATIIDYVNSLTSDTNVVNYTNAKELSDSSMFNISSAVGDKQIEKDILYFLEKSVRTGHANFHNQLYGGFNLWSFVGEVITALTSTSMATYEISPIATLLEKTLVNKMSHLVGFTDAHENGEGIMLTGGSNANMVAMLAARNTKFSDSKSKGAPSGLVAFCSKEAHYSFSKAANIIGLGTDNLISVASNENGQMIAAELEKEIKKSLEAGKIPFFLGATAGTTVKGAFDPFTELNDICKKYGLWFHVDGAWGGSVALSKTHRHLLEGAQLADSFTWDAHKLMHIPLIASFILFKKPGVLRESHDGGGNTYIFHDYENKSYDTGPQSLQCGRRVDSLKLWLSWRALGDEGYEKLMDQHFDFAKRLTNYINQNDRLKLFFEPTFLNICFQVLPQKQTNQKETNDLNLKLRERLLKDGRFMVNFSWDNDTPFFRLVIANPQSQYKDYIAFLDELLAIAHEWGR